MVKGWLPVRWSRRGAQDSPSACHATAASVGGLAARALASGRTRSIGVVTLGTALYGPASLLICIERAARDAGYALRVVNTLEGDPAGVAGAVESLLGQGVDGIVVSEPIDEGSVSLSVDIPVLVLGAPAAFGGPRAVAAGVGAESPARAATEHLLDLGHMTVHHLAGPQRWFAARDRLQGWRAALAAREREQPPVIEGDWSASSGYTAGRELAAAGDVTAVFAANDDMAVGLIRALLEAGLGVPRDVSVIGFDGIPVSAYVTPPLTTCASHSTPSPAKACGSWCRPSRNRTPSRHRRATHRSSSSYAPRRHPRRGVGGVRPPARATRRTRQPPGDEPGLRPAAPRGAAGDDHLSREYGATAIRSISGAYRERSSTPGKVSEA